jgi:hypothetical protein
LELAEQDFNRRALGEQKDKYLEKLRNRLKLEFESLSKKNEKASEKKCRDLVEELYRDLIEKKLKEKKLIHSTLVAEFKTLLFKYQEKAKGRSKYEALSDFLLSRLPDAFLIMDQQKIEMVNTEHETVVKELKKEISELKYEKKEQKEEFDLMRKAFDSERKRYLEEINQLREELEKKTKKLKKLEKAQDKEKDKEGKEGKESTKTTNGKNEVKK